MSFREGRGGAPPPIAVPYMADGKSHMRVVVKRPVEKGQLYFAVLEAEGLTIPAGAVGGTTRIIYPVIALETVTAERGTGGGKTVGDMVKCLYSGDYEGATLPAAITTTNGNRHIGLVGGSAALAAGSDPKHRAMFATDTGTPGAGPNKSLRLFGKPVIT